MFQPIPVSDMIPVAVRPWVVNAPGLILNQSRYVQLPFERHSAARSTAVYGHRVPRRYERPAIKVQHCTVHVVRLRRPYRLPLYESARPTCAHLVICQDQDVCHSSGYDMNRSQEKGIRMNFEPGPRGFATRRMSVIHHLCIVNKDSYAIDSVGNAGPI